MKPDLLDMLHAIELIAEALGLPRSQIALGRMTGPEEDPKYCVLLVANNQVPTWLCLPRDKDLPPNQPATPIPFVGATREEAVAELVGFLRAMSVKRAAELRAQVRGIEKSVPEAIVSGR